MNGKIHMSASDVWRYFCEHAEELRSDIVTIAARDDFGVDILLTEEDNLPLIIVASDDMEIDEASASTEEECEEAVSTFYDDYLFDDYVSGFIDSADDTESERDYEIEERDSELDDAIGELLTVLAKNVHVCAEDVNELCGDIKEHICEYLFKEHGISIYRPMYLECEDGTEEFFEFPYGEMELDD